MASPCNRWPPSERVPGAPPPKLTGTPVGLDVVFFGTPQAAVPTLEALGASRHRVLAVVTAPDRPKGRGMQVTASPVKEAARAAGLPVLQPPTLRAPETQAELAGLGAEVFVVCAYGLILPKAVLDIPRLGCINVHFSLLPAFRGAAPVAWAILTGQEVAGVTIMQMDPGLDTGPMLAQASEAIRPEDDTGALEDRLAVLGAGLLVEVLDRLERAPVPAQAQDDSRSSYAAKLTPAEARIDWSLPAPAIVNRIRAFSPRPGAWTTLDGRRLKLWRAALAPDPLALAPGAVLAGAGGAMLIGTGAGAITGQQVQPEGGRRMTGAELLLGRRGPATLV